MNIELQKTKTVIDIPKREIFDVCKELNRLSFQASRRDDALFYIRPDMCISQQNLDSLVNEWGRPLSSSVQDLIYNPTVADLFHALDGDLNQLSLTNSAGWFAYTSIRLDDGTIRGQGETPWFAMADAWIKVQEWKLGIEKQNANI
jgi:hypothetical protein